MAVMKNCWDVKTCGREPGGANVDTLGTCVAANDETRNGLNGGTNAGRICWSVAGTFVGGPAECVFAKKVLTCLNCDFFSLVREQQPAREFVMASFPDQ